MKTQIMKIGNKLFIKIPKGIEKLYELKPTELQIYVVEKNNAVILNCAVLNLNNDFKDSK